MCDKEDVERKNKTAKDTNATMELNPENFKQEYYLQYFFRFNETLQEEWGKICGMVEIRNTEKEPGRTTQDKNNQHRARCKRETYKCVTRKTSQGINTCGLSP